MESFFSLTLLVALTAGGLGTLPGAAAVVERRNRETRWWSAAATAPDGAVLAAMFGTASALVHLRFGHGPDSIEPIGAGQALATHPASLGIGVLTVLAAGGWAVATLRGRDRRS